MTSTEDQQIIEKIQISIQARSKSGRYYGSYSIRERLRLLDGALFRDDSGTYYLRTSRKTPSQKRQRVVLIFEIEGAHAQVITQTSDHYDWTQFDHIQAVPFSMNIDGESDGK